MTSKSARPEAWMVASASRCSSVSGVAARTSVIPMTPFMGVRISWLIAARNSDLARAAATASSLASRRRWSVWSRAWAAATPMVPNATNVATNADRETPGLSTQNDAPAAAPTNSRA